MASNKVQIIFFVAFLLLVIGLVALLFLPFLASIALAVMVAIVLKPMHRKILVLCRNRNGIAAAVSTFLALCILVIPLSLLVQQLTIESYSLYGSITQEGLGDFERVVDNLIEPLRTFYPTLTFDISGYLESLSRALIDNLGRIVSGTASIILSTFLWVMVLFFLFKDGHVFRKSLVSLSPLADEYDAQIMGRLEHAVNSIFKGIFLIALAQGLFVGLGFIIFGMENAVFWGTVAAFTAVLPGIGTGLVLIPATIYLVMSGSLASAIGLGIWGVAIVGLIDNIFLPILVGRGFTVHPIFVLFSVVGGILLFGPVGFFLGPLIIALLFALLDIYRLIILNRV